MANTQNVLPGVYQRPKCAYCGRTFKLPGAQGRYCNNNHFEAALLQQLNAEREARDAARAAELKAVTGDQVRRGTILEHIVLLGVALYGKRRWKRPLARDLRVDVRTLFRWLKGEYAPGEDKLRRLLVVAKQRKDGLAAAYEPALEHWRRLQGRNTA